MGLKIAVMGTGAVGGYAGAHMAQAGEDITFIDPWPEHVETMRAKGLRISHIRDVPEFTAKVRAMHLTDVQQFVKEKPIDLAFVCVKSYDTAWATAFISQYLSPNGFVVSLQNCMNEETVAGVVGWGKTVGCIASSITVELCEPGHVRRAAGKSGSRHTVFRAGEVHGRITDRVQEVCRLVSLADSAMVTTNLWGERWSGTSRCAVSPRRWAARQSASARRSAINSRRLIISTPRSLPRPARVTRKRRSSSKIAGSRKRIAQAAAESIVPRWARIWSRVGAPRSSSSTD